MTTATPSKLSKAPKVVLAAVFTAVIAGIKTNFALAKSVTLDNASYTWMAVIAVFQAYITANAAAVTAKLAATKAVATARAAEVTAKAMLKAFKQFVVGQYGAEAYSMFGLPAPKVPTTSAVKKAIGVSKRNSTQSAKKAALAAIAPSDEEAAALAAIGGAVGGGSTASSASSDAAPVATPPVTPTHS